jgi:hypothetical protein
MPTPQRWKDPGLKQYQERDAAERGYQRYLARREGSYVRTMPFDVIGFLLKRRWKRAQRPPSDPDAKT